MRAHLLTAGTAAVALAAAAAHAGPLDDPPGAEGASKLVVKSHGKRMAAQLETWTWCPEGEDRCVQAVRDYAYTEDTPRLPVHPGARMRIVTGKAARGVRVMFAGNRVDARRADGSRKRWRLRAPRQVRREIDIWIVADYRYRKDGRRYGGRYQFSLPLRPHEH